MYGNSVYKYRTVNRMLCLLWLHEYQLELFTYMHDQPWSQASPAACYIFTWGQLFDRLSHYACSL